MLESLGNTNIGSLNIEEPRPQTAYFDPEKNITRMNWEFINNWLTGEFRFTHLELLPLIKTLSPGVMPEFEYLLEAGSKTDDTMYQRTLSDIESHLNLAKKFSRPGSKQNHIQTAMTYLAPAIALFPGKKPELMALLDDELVGLALEELATVDSGLETKHYFQYVTVLPEKGLETTRSSEAAKDYLVKEVFYEAENYPEYSHEVDMFNSLPETAAQVKLLLQDGCPDVYKKYLPLMKAAFEHFRQAKDWSGFIKTAWGLQILTAHSAQILPDGTIEITPEGPETLTQIIPNLPEVRKF